MATGGVADPEHELENLETKEPDPGSPQHVDSESDGEDQSAFPMIPQQPQDDYTLEEVQPVQLVMASATKVLGMLAWVGLGCHLFALLCMIISFASPYWIQTYPSSFNTFRNMGLWEVCMENYMFWRDDSQELYNGCWWVFRLEKKFWKLRDWILPPWFIACEVMATGCLVVQIIMLVVMILVFLHCCPALNHEYHQMYSMMAASGLLFVSVVACFITCIVFGVMSQDWEWMPRPDMNFPSWGFGFFVISGLLSLVAAIAYLLQAKKAYKDISMKEKEYIDTMQSYEEQMAASQQSFQQQQYDAQYAQYGQYPQQYGQYPQDGQQYAQDGQYPQQYAQQGYGYGGYPADMYAPQQTDA